MRSNTKKAIIVIICGAVCIAAIIVVIILYERAVQAQDETVTMGKIEGSLVLSDQDLNDLERLVRIQRQSSEQVNAMAERIKPYIRRRTVASEQFVVKLDQIRKSYNCESCSVDLQSGVLVRPK
jgi:hypothetical protein